MIRIFLKVFFTVILVSVCFSTSTQAYAQCVNPAAMPGTVRYNNDYDVFQGCVSSGWVNFHDYTKTQAPQGCTNIGDVCTDGSVYIGEGTTIGPPTYRSVPMFATFYDAPRTTFNNGTGNFTDTLPDCTIGNIGTEQACFDGTSNTETLAGLLDAGSPHRAAIYCHNLTLYNRDDWYVPAFWEVSETLYENRAVIPNISTSGIQLFTSSTEFNNQYYISRDMAQSDPGTVWQGAKNTYHGSRKLRCIRRLGCFNPTASTSMLAYNTAEDVFQGCTISGWVALHEPGTGSGCSNPAASPGEYGYNSTEDVFQGCTASGWVSFHRN